MAPRSETEVEILHWPADAERLQAARDRDAPRLLLVAVAAPPPPLADDDLEDWVRLPANAEDIAVRVRHLEQVANEIEPAVPRSDREVLRG